MWQAREQALQPGSPSGSVLAAWGEPTDKSVLGVEPRDGRAVAVLLVRTGRLREGERPVRHRRERQGPVLVDDPVLTMKRTGIAALLLASTAQAADYSAIVTKLPLGQACAFFKSKQKDYDDAMDKWRRALDSWTDCLNERQRLLDLGRRDAVVRMTPLCDSRHARMDAAHAEQSALCRQLIDGSDVLKARGATFPCYAFGCIP